MKDLNIKHLKEAFKKLEIETGYEMARGSMPAAYFAEIKELNLKVYGLSEKEALGLLKLEALHLLRQKLSLVKELLKA